MSNWQFVSHYLNRWWLNHRRIYALLGLNELHQRKHRLTLARMKIPRSENKINVKSYDISYGFYCDMGMIIRWDQDRIKSYFLTFMNISISVQFINLFLYSGATQGIASYMLITVVSVHSYAGQIYKTGQHLFASPSPKCHCLKEATQQSVTMDLPDLIHINTL